MALSVRRVVAEWIIQVEDQGLGIPAAEPPGLPTAFRRGSNIGSIKGTGVGLFITKECVELQGGRLEVRAAPGVGTTISGWAPVMGLGATTAD